MREEVVYEWRIKWVGKWTRTKHKCTEEAIRKEHPEAIRLDHTREVRKVAETDEDFRAIEQYASMYVKPPNRG